jgi:hypothetical protein
MFPRCSYRFTQLNKKYLIGINGEFDITACMRYIFYKEKHKNDFLKITRKQEKVERNAYTSIRGAFVSRTVKKATHVPVFI